MKATGPPRAGRGCRGRVASAGTRDRAALLLTPVPIAHAGHWLQGALYLAPVVVIVLLLFVQSRRDRLSDDEPG